MTRIDFMNKYNITNNTISNIKRRSPNLILKEDLDYEKVDKEIQIRLDIKKFAEEAMYNRVASDLEFLCSEPNKDVKAHHFMNNVLYRNLEHLWIRDSTLCKFIKILERYGR